MCGTFGHKACATLSELAYLDIVVCLFRYSYCFFFVFDVSLLPDSHAVVSNLRFDPCPVHRFSTGSSGFQMFLMNTRDRANNWHRGAACETDIATQMHREVPPTPPRPCVRSTSKGSSEPAQECFVTARGSSESERDPQETHRNI